MKFDLLKAYDDIIFNDKTTQEQLNNYYNAFYMDYFVRPDLRINQRAGHNSKGEFIEGLHIYPDRKCICEILEQIQKRLNNEADIINKLGSNRLSSLLFICELVNYHITNYFGSTENIRENTNVFYSKVNNQSEYMANLSDFKNKKSAMCIERALATYIVLYVIYNTQELNPYFPFKPYLSYINYCPNITEKSGCGGHALCGLISKNGKEVYLLDPTNYGLVEDTNGQKQQIYGLYELSKEEIELMFNGKAIVPTLFRCKHIDGLVQLSHRAISQKASEFEKLIKEIATNINIDVSRDLPQIR